MFHWICPECGREIAPTVRECPACDGAEQAELVLAGVVEASARTLNVEASARTVNTEASKSAASPETPAVNTKSEASEVSAVSAGRAETQIAEATAFPDAAIEPVLAADGVAIPRQEADAPLVSQASPEASTETSPEASDEPSDESRAATHEETHNSDAASELEESLAKPVQWGRKTFAEAPAASSDKLESRDVNAHTLEAYGSDSGGLQLLTALVESGAVSAGSQDLQARLEAAAKVIAQAPQNPPIPEPERLLIPEIVDPATEISRLMEARTAALFGTRNQEPRQKFRSIRTKMVESRLVDTRSMDAKALESRSVEAKPVEIKSIETRLIDSRPIDAQPVQDQPVEAHPIETHRVETHLVEAQAAQIALPTTPAADASSVENMPALADATGVDKKVDAKSEAQIVEPHVVEATPVVAQTSENAAPEVKSGETKISETAISDPQAPGTNIMDSRPAASREAESVPRLGRLSRMLLAAGVDLHGQRGERRAPPAAVPAQVTPVQDAVQDAVQDVVQDAVQEETRAATPASQDPGSPEAVTPAAVIKPEAPTEEPSLLTPDSASLSTSLPTSSASLRALDAAIAHGGVKAKAEVLAAPEKPLIAEDPEAAPVAPAAEAPPVAESAPGAESPIPQESTPKESGLEASTPNELANDAVANAGENAAAAAVASPSEDLSVVTATADAAAPPALAPDGDAQKGDSPKSDAPDPPLGAKLPLPGSLAVTAPLAMAPFAPQNLSAEPVTDRQGLIDRAALATQPEKPVKGPALVQVQMRLAMPAVPSSAVRPTGSVEHEAPAASASDAAQAPGTPVRQPSPRMGRLVRYSPIVKKMLLRAAPEVSPCRTSVDFGVTVPGPVLSETLLSFKDPQLKPAFVEQAALKKGFNYGLLILVILIGSGLGFLLANVTRFFQFPETDAQAAAATTPEPKPEAAAPAPTPSNSLSKSIEVTGFRIVENAAGKMEVQYIVVNHSAVRLPDAKVFVTLYSTDARVGQPPVCQFTFAVPNLGPFEAKDMASNFESAQSGNLPEWRSLRANVTIGR